MAKFKSTVTQKNVKTPESIQSLAETGDSTATAEIEDIFGPAYEQCEVACAIIDAVQVLSALERAPEHQDTHPSHNIRTGGGYAHGRRVAPETLPRMLAHARSLMCGGCPGSPRQGARFCGHERKRPSTLMFWARAFKGEEETKGFERILIVRLGARAILTNIMKGAVSTLFRPAPFTFQGQAQEAGNETGHHRRRPGRALFFGIGKEEFPAGRNYGDRAQPRR